MDGAIFSFLMRLLAFFTFYKADFLNSDLASLSLETNFFTVVGAALPIKG